MREDQLAKWPQMLGMFSWAVGKPPQQLRVTMDMGGSSMNMNSSDSTCKVLEPN